MSADATPPTDLYRFFDANDVLLYIGISLNAAQRASQHRTDKHWWGEVHRMEVEHLECDRGAALGVERAAILAECPLYNVTHNTTIMPSASPVKAKLPLEVMIAYAFGMNDGTCPVGLVTKIWGPSFEGSDWEFEIAKYHWIYDEFWGSNLILKWSNVDSVVRAESETTADGVVFDMDPLSTFQTDYYERHK